MWVNTTLKFPEDGPGVSDFFIAAAQAITRANDGLVIVATDRNSGRIVGTSHFFIQDNSEWWILRFLSGFWRKFLPLLGTMVSRAPIGAFWRAPVKFWKRLSSLDRLDEERIKCLGYEKHVYLLHLAVDPLVQSNGTGSVLLRGIGNLCDVLNLKCYLETDEERLRTYYEKNGFEVKVSYTIDDPDEPFLPNFGMVRPVKGEKAS